MKTSVEKISSLERKLNIQVPANEVQQAFNTAFTQVQKVAALKGFRKGKAPLSMVKSVFGDRVREDVVNNLVQKYYSSALQDLSLIPVSYPTIEFDSLDEAKDFEFSAEFEVRPEVNLVQVEKLKVGRELPKPADEYVERSLKEIAESRAELKELTEQRPSQKNDHVTIDFEGHLESGPLENGSATDFVLELGSGRFIPGFEDGVIGMTVGEEKEISVKFPDDYQVENLKSQPVRFKVKLKKTSTRVIPEMTDEFIQSLGGKFENLDDLKKNISQDFESREQKRIKDELKTRLMRKLVQANPVEVPKSLLAEQKKALHNDMKKRLEEQGMDESAFGEYKSKWDEDFTRTATFMIQSSFLMDKIAVDNNLRATPEDIEAKLQEYAKQTGIELDRVKEFYGDDDRRSRLAYSITEERVVEWLLERSDLYDLSEKELEEERRSESAADA